MGNRRRNGSCTTSDHRTRPRGSPAAFAAECRGHRVPGRAEDTGNDAATPRSGSRGEFMAGTRPNLPGTATPASRILARADRRLCGKSKVQSPKSKVQSPKSKVQGPRSKVLEGQRPVITIAWGASPRDSPLPHQGLKARNASTAGKRRSVRISPCRTA